MIGCVTSPVRAKWGKRWQSAGESDVPVVVDKYGVRLNSKKIQAKTDVNRTC